MSEEEKKVLKPGMIIRVPSLYLDKRPFLYQVEGIYLGAEGEVNLVNLWPINEKIQSNCTIMVPYEMILPFQVYEAVEIR